MTTGTRTLISPPRNMVQEVRNIIEGYSMGSIRALAQDPVQNSIDARRPGVQTVSVEYRIFERTMPDGEPMTLLSVTDTGTTGLRGHALSSDDLHERAQLELRPDENWAAWEAMGYTKVGEDSLGSRGQGKAAFLYHSRHAGDFIGSDGRALERMLILYDSLLDDGTYRLGARLARPDDVIISPPYEGEEARQIIQGEWADYGMVVPLGLEPLTEVGTRIIVPFLTEEARDAIMAGELRRWLERCWWRAVQTQEVEIHVVGVDGSSTSVAVPSWWQDETWRGRPLPENVHVEENIPLAPGDPLKIKRIVLFHDATLGLDEIPGYTAQYAGVQLLRGRQWIETLTAAEKFGDLVPQGKREGFRGFVEFDRFLDRDLRDQNVERPQHDGFRRRRVFVNQIDEHIESAVRRFAEEQGWTHEATTEPRDDRTANEVLKRVAELFVAEGSNGQTGQQAAWRCRAELTFPHAATARVSYGETIGNVYAECEHRPAFERKDVEFSLELIAPDGTSTEVARRTGKTLNGTAGADFGDFTIAYAGGFSARELACPERDRYRFRVRCFYEGETKASATRSFYVECDPPTPPDARPFGASLDVANTSADRVRVNNGETIRIAGTINNRSGVDAKLSVSVSLGDLLLEDDRLVMVPGRPPGDAPGTYELDYDEIRVFTQPLGNAPAELMVVLEPGKHRVVLDARNAEGEVVAHASKTVWVETNPTEGGADTPFEVRAREDRAYPIWELVPPAGDQGVWILRYAPQHPTFRAAQASPGGAITRLWAETFCSALVEWALRLHRDSGDEGGFKLLSTSDTAPGSPLWERYNQKVEGLISSYADPIACLTSQRAVVSLMLCLLED